MITRDDCMSILIKLEDRGVDKASINKCMRQLMVSKEIPLEVLKFISVNRGIEVTNFYELLRSNHNKKKSPLYLNLVKEIEDKEEVLTTLSSMLTQIFLYSRKLDDANQFLRAVRAEEITQVLAAYCQTGNVESCIKLIKLIRSDILVLEYISGRRELAN